MGNLKVVCLMFYNDSKTVSCFTCLKACQQYMVSCVSFLISTAGVIQVVPCISGLFRCFCSNTLHFYSWWLNQHPPEPNSFTLKIGGNTFWIVRRHPLYFTAALALCLQRVNKAISWYDVTTWYGADEFRSCFYSESTK